MLQYKELIEIRKQRSELIKQGKDTMDLDNNLLALQGSDIFLHKIVDNKKLLYYMCRYYK